MANMDIPFDVTKIIIGFLKDNPKALSACCLVHRSWLGIAQRLLFDEVVLKEPFEIRSLIDSLRKFKRLNGHIAGLKFQLEAYDKAENKKLILKCLRRTPKLKRLSFDHYSTTCCNDDTLEEIRGLDHLEELIFEGPLVKLDYQLLLELPTSLRRLQLEKPRDELMKLLPEICENLWQTDGKQNAIFASQDRSLEDKPAENKSQTGLQSLSLTTESSLLPDQVSVILESLTHSLGSTLTDLRLASGVGTQGLKRFLSALPLLRTLDLEIDEPTPDLFDGLLEHTFRHLCSLKLHYGDSCTLADFPAFWQKLNNLISNCSRLYSLTLAMETPPFHFEKPQVTQMMMHQFIMATSAADALSPCTRLRHFELKSIKISVEALECLCQSATLLNKLAIVLPSDEISRIGSALARLQLLSSLRIDDDGIELYDGDATELVRSNSALTEFSIGTTDWKIDRICSGLESTKLHHHRLKLKPIKSTWVSDSSEEDMW